MKPLSDALRAHQRLVEFFLRDRITTHRHEPLPERIQGRHLGEVPEGLIEEVKRLREAGESRESICRSLRMGDRLFRRIKDIIQARERK